MANRFNRRNFLLLTHLRNSSATDAGSANEVEQSTSLVIPHAPRILVLLALMWPGFELGSSEKQKGRGIELLL